MNRWIIATRPWSFPASAMPALVTMTYLLWQQSELSYDVTLNIWNGVLAIIGAIVFQAAGNIISDYYDYSHGVDRPETFGSARLLVDGVFRPSTLLLYGIGLLFIGIVIGLFLLFTSGTQLIWIGVIGVVGTLFYYLFKYRALGDILIFIIYGQLIALGTAYVMTSRLCPEILLISAPIGLLVVNILHANNTRDIMHDRQAGIRTLAMHMGMRGSRIEYWSMNIIAFLGVIALTVCQYLPWTALIVIVTWPLAWKNCIIMQNATIDNPEKIKNLDAQSAQLVLLFSFSIIVSLIASTYLL